MEIPIDINQYLELEKIAVGAFHPIDAFMDERSFRSVVDTMRLPDGSVFPLPVYLAVDETLSDRLRGSNSVRLTYNDDVVGEIGVESVFRCDKADVVRKLFGTDDKRHPGVRHFLAQGDLIVGGPVRLNKPTELGLPVRELTPTETRAAFKDRGWHRIVGFQTRNVPHRAHEYLQRVALEHCDGLFIQPLVGRRKVGDYAPEAILEGYQALISAYFRPDKVMLGILSTAMRFAGPREAVFHAIIRRNYGCTHFIVGRDHAGVGNYYEKYAAHRLIEQFDGELGIEVMTLHGPFYCTKCEGIVTEHLCPHYGSDPSAIIEISGTNIRRLLSGDQLPDSRLMRSEVLDRLRPMKLFIEEDDL